MGDFTFLSHLSFIITEEPLEMGAGLPVYVLGYYCYFFFSSVALQGDVAGSLAEFDKAVEMDPRQKQCTSP
jgi:hypothetical protein